MLDAQVREAVRDTARSSEASSMEYSNLQKVAKCCSSYKAPLLATLEMMLAAEPNLARARAAVGARRQV